MKLTIVILLLTAIISLEYCSTELSVPEERKGISAIPYKSLATTYYNNDTPYLSETISGIYTTIGESGAITGYQLNFNFSDFTIKFTLYKTETEGHYIYNEFTPDSKYIKISIPELKYDRIDGYLRITEYTHNCVNRDEFFCYEYYVTPRGVFELDFINYGEDNIADTEDDIVFHLKKGMFYPE